MNYQMTSEEESVRTYTLNSIAQTASNILNNTENTLGSYIPSLSASGLASGLASLQGSLQESSYPSEEDGYKMSTMDSIGTTASNLLGNASNALKSSSLFSSLTSSLPSPTQPPSLPTSAHAPTSTLNNILPNGNTNVLSNKDLMDVINTDNEQNISNYFD